MGGKDGKTAAITPNYWRTGRQRLTADIAGGATVVTVADTHGKDAWPNLVRGCLPDRVPLARRQ